MTVDVVAFVDNTPGDDWVSHCRCGWESNSCTSSSQARRELNAHLRDECEMNPDRRD